MCSAAVGSQQKFRVDRAVIGAWPPNAPANSGIHRFVARACDDKKTYNIIGHKYLIEPSGRIGRDNFYGWTKEDREDYDPLMVAWEEKPGDHERLNEIRDKAGNAIVLALC
jgi:hypothetical protein